MAALTVTEAAAKKIIEISAQENKSGYGLRMSIRPGGCSGFMYGLDFAEAEEEGDIIIKARDVRIFIDKDSIEFIKGSRLDYFESLEGSGFKIDNPNVEKTCSCGKSVC